MDNNLNQNNANEQNNIGEQVDNNIVNAGGNESNIQVSPQVVQPSEDHPLESSNHENIMNNDKKKSKGGLVVILIILIMLLVGVIAVVYLGKNGYLGSSSTNNGDINSNVIVDDNGADETLIEDDALEIGKKLYDKATEIYSMEVLRPYCGLSDEEIKNRETDSLGTTSGIGAYYKSDFSSKEALQEYINQYLKEELTLELTKSDVVDDLSLLSNADYAYTDYVLKDGYLYCRVHTGKGWLTSYLGKYDIELISDGDEEKQYNINSYYANDPNSPTCNLYNGFDSCKDDEYNTKVTTFVIKKINDNWVVSDYTLHD